MRIKSFVNNRNKTNTWIISDEESHEAMIIDCGCCSDAEFFRISKYIDDENLRVKHSLCTHLHFDHVWGLQYIFDTYGVKTIANPRDEYILEWNRMCSVFMNLDDKERSLLDYDTFIWLSEASTSLSVGDCCFSIIETPGHTPGSISLFNGSKGVLFSGDVIFEKGIGRTDFEGGNAQQLLGSINKILALPDSVTVFPGHGSHFQIADRKNAMCNVASHNMS